LAPVVAERRSDLADALEQAVVAHMDVRPDRCDQVLLAEGPSGVGGKQRQHLECFRPKLDGFAAGTAQLDALLIQFKTSKAEHPASHTVRPGQQISEMLPGRANFRKISEPGHSRALSARASLRKAAA
jgi:hypothetical protein